MIAKLRGIGLLLALCAVNVLLFLALFTLLDLRDEKRKDSITIGSKAFTESIVLAEAMALLIEQKTSLEVKRRFNLGGTHICFNALLSGEIDLYPEYTGTGLMAILEQPVITDPDRAFEAVRTAFEQEYSLIWLEPLAFNNTYALAMSETKAARLDIVTISDLAKHRGLSAGFTSEFMARKDGYPGLKERYGLELKPGSMEAGLMYSAVAEGKVDVISAYATDGRIDKFELRVLVDDKHFFPPYQAAPLVRKATLLAHPELKRVLSAFSGAIDDSQMRAINAAVDIHGQKSQRAAADVLDRLRSSERAGK